MLIVDKSDELLFVKKFRIVFIYVFSSFRWSANLLIQILITFRLDGEIVFVVVIDNSYYK